MLKVGQVVQLTIEKPAVGGRMIARVDGQVVLVGGAIPSERVTARVASISRGVVVAETVEILEPSPHRREPICDLACGGSLFAHIEYGAQLSIKAAVIADALTRIGRVSWPEPIAVAPSREEGYRMRARLHLRGGRLGFFREESHTLCDARATRQMLPSSFDALDAVASVLGDRIASAEIEITENVEAGERVVHVGVEGGVPGPPGWMLSGVDGLTGLTLSGGPGHGAATRVLSGVPWVTDVLDVDGVHVTLRRHVRAFFQGNRYLLAPVVSHVSRMVPARARVLDLYAGVGVFGLAAAATKHASVVAVEGEEWAAADLDANATHVGGVEISHQSVESYLRRRRPVPDMVMLDPPRTGLSRVAVAGVVTLEAPLVAYVSCDVATLARDARRLIDGGYVIQSIAAFDLFPNTPHIETVTVFRR